MAVSSTAQRKRAFLADFERHGILSTAARAAGVSRRCVYLWQEKDEQFVLAFRQAEIEATERLEQELFRRAVEGVEKPVYQNGKLVGHLREFSDTLLIFSLKARAPQKYRENRLVTVEGSLTLAELVSDLVTDRDA